MPYRYGSSTNVFWHGEKESGLTCGHDEQNYEKIKATNLANNTLFEDTVFPAVKTSVFSRSPVFTDFEWRRPYEIVNYPKFYIEKGKRFDIKQGQLGNCWLLAAVSSLTLNKPLFERVVPMDQTFNKMQYAGIFHFRFWQYGRWVDISIDDRLPTQHGELMFMQSNHENEFWSSLLEKAYAKLYGSYESLSGGNTNESMLDFTGGLCEVYKFSKMVPDNLFDIMKTAYERYSLMCCTIDPHPTVVEYVQSNGLIMGHAYGITKVLQFGYKGGIKLIRIRNPWGDDSEWNGRWSENSLEWTRYAEFLKNRTELLADKTDGEFFNDYADFIVNFNTVEICHLNPDVLREITANELINWKLHMTESAWIKAATSGGCRNFLSSFAVNPQYKLIIGGDDKDSLAVVVISLIQKNRRYNRKLGSNNLTIGYCIYKMVSRHKVPVTRPLDENYFKYTSDVGRCPQFSNLREVSGRHQFPPGTYCIIPSTYTPEEHGEYLLRVFTEVESTLQPYDDHLGLDESLTANKRSMTSLLSLHRVRGGTVNKKPSVSSPIASAVRDCYNEIRRDDLNINAVQLKAILDKAFTKEYGLTRAVNFDLQTCRHFVWAMTSGSSPRMNYPEFQGLWTSITILTEIFLAFSGDRNYLSTFQLRKVWSEAGYHINNKVLVYLVQRYADVERTRIGLSKFFAATVKLNNLIEQQG